MNRPSMASTPVFALGKHMTVEYYDCDSQILSDAAAVEAAFLKAAADSGATVIGSDFHYFKPQGVSGFVVIAESHFSVHAWPEHDYAAVDIFTCGESIDFQAAVNSLKESLRSGETVVSAVMNRGVITNDGLEKRVPLFEDRTHHYSLSWKTQYNRYHARGLSASIDIYNCAATLLGDAAQLRRFVRELCGRIGLEYAGECQLTDFVHGDREAGLSMVQALDSAMITGNFAVATGAAYLDIFSCSYFEPRVAAEFAAAFFHGSNYRMQVALRR